MYSDSLAWSKKEANVYGDQIICIEQDLKVINKNNIYNLLNTFSNRHGIILWLCCHDNQAQQILDSLPIDLTFSFEIKKIVLNTCYSKLAKSSLKTPFMPLIVISDINYPVSDEAAFLASWKLFGVLTFQMNNNNREKYSVERNFLEQKIASEYIIKLVEEYEKGIIFYLISLFPSLFF
jgi:hypothetical protein